MSNERSHVAGADAAMMPGLDEAMEPADFDAVTLAFLGDRIARSRSYEDFIYREVELDEILRMLDFACRAARGQGAGALARQLASLRARVLEAHRIIATTPILPLLAVLALDPGRGAGLSDTTTFN